MIMYNQEVKEMGMIVVEVKCWKCGCEFNANPNAEYATCPCCYIDNMVGICANFKEINQEQVTA